MWARAHQTTKMWEELDSPNNQNVRTWPTIQANEQTNCEHYFDSPNNQTNWTKLNQTNLNQDNLKNQNEQNQTNQDEPKPRQTNEQTN